MVQGAHARFIATIALLAAVSPAYADGEPRRSSRQATPVYGETITVERGVRVHRMWGGATPAGLVAPVGAAISTEHGVRVIRPLSVGYRPIEVMGRRGAGSASAPDYYPVLALEAGLALSAGLLVPPSAQVPADPQMDRFGIGGIGGFGLGFGGRDFGHSHSGRSHFGNAQYGKAPFGMAPFGSRHFAHRVHGGWRH